MANITGTNGKDTLTSTTAYDIIKGLGGNDLIISNGGDGPDLIDGGAGIDTVDYSPSNNSISVGINKSDGSIVINRNIPSGYGYFITEAQDKLTSVETVIASTKLLGTVDFYDGPPRPTDTDPVTISLDLSKNKLTYSAAAFGTKTITVKNFQNASGGAGNDRIKGNDLDNLIIGNGGSDTIIGSKGNDTIYGFVTNIRNYRGSFGVVVSEGGTNTMDYSNLGAAVKINLPSTYGERNFSATNSQTRVNFTVDKSGFGTDKISDFSKIIGANNKKNTIDLSSAGYGNQLDVNLAKNSMNIITPSDGVYDTFTAKYELVNFVNVIGGKYNDTIVGGNKNSTLTGGGGNDKITGGNNNDIITGTDSTYKGVGEIDTLTGGGGKDKFVLGDKNGAYYVGKGANDYALITDFNLFEDSISIGSLKNYSFASAGNNTIDLYSGKDIKTRDLIAKIQIAGGISTVTSNAKSAMSPDASLNALVGKINIIST
jgi:Ca2+-binding RTX toxin-like protein